MPYAFFRKLDKTKDGTHTASLQYLPKRAIDIVLQWLIIFLIFRIILSTFSGIADPFLKCLVLVSYYSSISLYCLCPVCPLCGLYIVYCITWIVYIIIIAFLMLNYFLLVGKPDYKFIFSFVFENILTFKITECASKRICAWIFTGQLLTILIILFFQIGSYTILYCLKRLLF